ncbi:AMP-binding protein [Rhodococcus sp. T7]|uniref:AMP-binding protein n=1 Tax=Rhodococcus sp. T7 TaxID=627444 RepID=UPI0013CCCE70|nr:AMP-binding protein [Rhodococcus sp. T7]KAF0957247.1 Long-chain-fatty-acid--CoA ligase FadD13 [Rhodococcus sp. T7]KAF0966707.1 Long-chain-fatty-acid--CoA ligase FadD13 [Rhodococcus sp. T7]
MRAPDDFHPVQIIRDLARTHPDSIALRYRDSIIAFAELDARASRVGRALLQSGVTGGQRVGYLGRNWPEFFEILFGCAKIGAVLAPLNWRLTTADLAELVSDADTRIVLTDREFMDAAPPDVTRLTIGEDYEAWRDAEDSVDPGVVSGPDDAFIQFYTSGTTGLPKAVVITNSNLAHLFQAAARWRVDSDSVVSVVMPLFHMGGSAWAFVALFRGAQCVLVPDFDAPALVADLGRLKITNVLVAPAMLQMMVDVPGAGEADFSALRSIVYGASPISLPLLHRVRDCFDVPLIQVFGLTETCGAIAQLDPDDHRGELLASVGKPYPWVEVEIRDPSTELQLPAGRDGEIWVRSAQCSKGYWRRPEETAELRNAEGWLRTGDVGRLDNAGYLFITDRLKDMIITGGENVYPADVERVLVTHPQVAEVAVIGVPDRTWGEAVTAIVVPRKAAQVNEATLITWLRPRIAGFRRPRRVVFVDTLPRNPSGKVLKGELRRLIPGPAAATEDRPTAGGHGRHEAVSQ